MLGKAVQVSTIDIYIPGMDAALLSPFLLWPRFSSRGLSLWDASRDTYTVSLGRTALYGDTNTYTIWTEFFSLHIHNGKKIPQSYINIACVFFNHTLT